MILAALLVSASMPLELRFEGRGAVTFAPVMNAYGAFVEAGIGAPLWHKPKSSGLVELGLVGGYQNGPNSQLRAWLSPDETLTGAEHRIHVWLAAGPAVQLLASRRLRVAGHVIIGWSELIVSGTLNHSGLGISGSRRDVADAVVMGIELAASYLFTTHVGVTLHALGHPLPSSWRIAGYASLSLGIMLVL